jgi:AcrR family transcriptional regulator
MKTETESVRQWEGLTALCDGSTFFDVPSENVERSIPDRRTRKRAARRDHLLDLAADLVERVGVDGLTMAALAEAADYAPASLYTYFPSRGALLADLQQRALSTLADVARSAVARWEADLATRPPDGGADGAVAHLARLWAFSDLFLAAPLEQAREFQLQQQLLVTAGAESIEDAARVVPAAMVVLDVPRRLIAGAARVGAIGAEDDVLDPLHELVDRSMVRTLSWVVALNGALLADRLTTGLPSTGAALGSEITASLLRGWGADPTATSSARNHAARWRTSGGTP